MTTNEGKVDEQKLLYPKLVRVIDSYKERLFSSKQISDKNKAHLKRYFKHCEARGLTIGRMTFVYQYLYTFSTAIGKKDFMKLTRIDIDNYFAKLRTTRKQSSVNGYISILKAFYRQLNGLTSTDPAPEPVKHLRKEKAISYIKKERLLTDEDIDNILEAAKALKWKAIIAVLLCGLRPSELRSLKFGDITFDNECIKIRVSGGKMGRKIMPRTVFPKKGSSFLQAWVLNNPRRDDPDAFLFGKELEDVGFVPLGQNELRSALYRFSKKAGVINKMWCAYGYRHKVLTEWYTNPQLGYEHARRLAGHGSGSKMSEVYCHVDDEDLKRAFFGSEKNKNCDKCGNINPAEAEFCSRCGFCFSTKKLIEKHNKTEELTSNGIAALEYLVNKKPEILREIIEKWKLEDRN